MKKVALRTDESCFANLKEYPFAPHYIPVHHPDYAPLRMHYIDIDKIDINSVDEGSSTNCLLLLHGCPSWSYLYRHVISSLCATNNKQALRIIAPDFIGCGKSDKLLARADYSYDFYVATLRELIAQLNLDNITLVCQDWGGPIGLRVVSEMPERFSCIIATNTLLPNCETFPRGVNNWPGERITNWVNYTRKATDISISQVMQGVTLKKLPADILAAYDAPFPDARYKQGMLGWPSLIPLSENAAGINENRKTWEFLEHSKLPFITAFSDSDLSTADWEIIFQQRVRGARNRQHTKILQAGHMVQEDNSEALINIITKLLKETVG